MLSTRARWAAVAVAILVAAAIAVSGAAPASAATMPASRIAAHHGNDHGFGSPTGRSTGRAPAGASVSVRQSTPTPAPHANATARPGSGLLGALLNWLADAAGQLVDQATTAVGALAQPETQPGSAHTSAATAPSRSSSPAVRRTTTVRNESFSTPGRAVTSSPSRPAQLLTNLSQRTVGHSSNRTAPSHPSSVPTHPHTAGTPRRPASTPAAPQPTRSPTVQVRAAPGPDHVPSLIPASTDRGRAGVTVAAPTPPAKTTTSPPTTQKHLAAVTALFAPRLWVLLTAIGLFVAAMIFLVMGAGYRGRRGSSH